MVELDRTSNPLAASVEWKPVDRGIQAIVIAPYIPGSHTPSSGSQVTTQHQTSLYIGDRVHIIEEYGSDWYRGYVFTTGLSAGSNGGAAAAASATATATATAAAAAGPKIYVFPKNRVFIKPNQQRRKTGGLESAAPPLGPSPSAVSKRRLSDVSFANKAIRHPIPSPILALSDTTAGTKEPLVDEIAATLREWAIIMRQRLMDQDYDTVKAVTEHFHALYQGRRELLSRTLSKEEHNRLRVRLIRILEDGNSTLDLPLVIRHPERGYLISERNTSIIKIFRLHVERSSIVPSGKTDRDATISIVTGEGPLSPGYYASAADEATVRLANILFRIKRLPPLLCAPGEYLEFIFSIYDPNLHASMTDDWVISAGDKGELLKSSPSSGLFTHLPQRGHGQRMFLVCRVLRVGKLAADRDQTSWSDRSASFVKKPFSLASSAGSSQQESLSSLVQHCRKPFGVAVLDVSEVLNGFPVDSEFSMRIVPVPSDNEFGRFHEYLADSDPASVDASSKIEPIVMQLGRTSDGLAGYDDAPASPAGVARIDRREIVDTAAVHRNTLYITLDSGNFVPVAKAGRTIQVIASVRLLNGEILRGCIRSGKAELQSLLKSIVIPNNSSPRWGESFGIDLEPNTFYGAHVLFFFHRFTGLERGKESPFAFAYMPLCRELRTVVPNGEHRLRVYRYDEKHLSSTSYLRYPFDDSEFTPFPMAPESAEMPPLLSDAFIIKSSLCSTSLTQNIHLVNLFNWVKTGGHQPGEIDTILSNLRVLSEFEVTQFLPEILDALFGILDSEENSTGGYDDVLFETFVDILKTSSDKRFPNFRSQVDQYIETSFKSRRAWGSFLKTLQRMIPDRHSEEKPALLRSTIRVWSFIFRFAIQSHSLDQKHRSAASPLGKSEPIIMDARGDLSAPRPQRPSQGEFRALVASILTEINRLMAHDTPKSIIGSQAIALQNFALLVPELLKIYPPSSVADIVIKFTDSIRINNPDLNEKKILFIHRLTRSTLLSEPMCWVPLTEAFVRWILEYLNGQWGASGASGASTTAHSGADASPQPSEKYRPQVQDHSNWTACLDVIACLVDRLQKLGDQAGKGTRQSEIGGALRGPIIATRGMVMEPLPLIDNSRRSLYNSSLIRLSSLIPRLLDTFNDMCSTIPVHQRTRDHHNREHSSNQFDKRLLILTYIAAVILAIFHMMSEDQISSFWEDYLKSIDAAGVSNTLVSLLNVLKSLLEGNGFPNSWIAMHFLAHKLMVKLLRPTGKFMKSEFLPRSDAKAVSSGTSLMGKRSSYMSDSGATASDSTAQPPDPSRDFNQCLWTDYFEVLLSLLNSEWIHVEKYGPIQSWVAFKLGADVRGEAGELLKEMWKLLEDGERDPVTNQVRSLQLNFIPSLVGRFLELTMSPHPVLRKCAIDLLFSSMEREFVACGSFARVEQECFDRIELLATNLGRVDEHYRRFVVGSLEAKFASRSQDAKNNAALVEMGSKFLVLLDRFLAICLAVRNISQSNQDDEDRFAALVRMIRFASATGRQSIYIKYVHKLVEVCVKSGNFTEAGLTLKLHADLYSWEHTIAAFPVDENVYAFSYGQSMFQRKEQLYLEILGYLENGKAWERAIELCKELEIEYERWGYDYVRVAEIAKRKAVLYFNIANVDRYSPSYYRVGFYGQGFGPALRGKEFVFRGGEWEKIDSFSDRILSRYPGSTPIRTAAAVSEDAINSPGKKIQITAVAPEEDPNVWLKYQSQVSTLNWEPRFGEATDWNGDVGDLTKLDALAPELSPDSDGLWAKASVIRERFPHAIRDYYKSNETRVFTFSRPIRRKVEGSSRSKDDPVNEYLELWIEKTVIVTEDSFPHLTRRSEVARTIVHEISPIQNAIITVREKNRQLLDFERRYKPMLAALAGSDMRSVSSHGTGIGIGVGTRSLDRRSTGPKDTISSGGLTSAKNIQLFTMALTGAVDAPVNGGIPMYRTAFLSGDKSEEAEILEKAILEQVKIIQRCLSLHEQIVPSDMRPHHETLTAFFERNFAYETKLLRSIENEESLQDPRAILERTGTARLSQHREITHLSLPKTDSFLSRTMSMASSASSDRRDTILYQRFSTATSSTNTLASTGATVSPLLGTSSSGSFDAGQASGPSAAAAAATANPQSTANSLMHSPIIDISLSGRVSNPRLNLGESELVGPDGVPTQATHSPPIDAAFELLKQW
ncbi:uncharacterized protein BJ171DRAFT_582314 [Polychytrium aggregatum]|uniref:uncharacterized protein n=1 Tax=Polychytrium aggregatum TaxID=110093 RepID=UPI0022FF3C18|nr:uncharacterized protein BJ171DRAFT_582314 [Polychytrium aggregatum]KAI9203937.1 hypothetical protein BJ171DRAFT_582314 [Polychytrium aggregatum]